MDAPVAARCDVAVNFYIRRARPDLAHNIEPAFNRFPVNLNAECAACLAAIPGCVLLSKERFSKIQPDVIISGRNGNAVAKLSLPSALEQARITRSEYHLPRQLNNIHLQNHD